MYLCVTCAVEREATPTPGDLCPLCDDERQYIPRGGQQWTTLRELETAGQSIRLIELEPTLIALCTEPSIGIGQQSLLAKTEGGNLLWDPPGYLDETSVAGVLSHGPLAAIAASHPHMFGTQVEWSHATGAAILVNSADASWLQREDPAIQFWSNRYDVVPGITLHQIGGHFPGSAVAVHDNGAEGRGVLLAGDTIMVNPDGTASFMRSYHNRIPLSGAVVQRVADTVAQLRFDRLYNNFGMRIDADASTVVRKSADRHIAWVRGDFDHLT